MTWPMKTTTDPNRNVKRGACIECKDPKTVDEVLISIDCNGAVCAKCAKLPHNAKRLRS